MPLNLPQSYPDRFSHLIERLKAMYPEEMFHIEGIHTDNMDINKAARDFFRTSERKGSATADHSIDPNANVAGRDVITFNYEVPKPIMKLNSLYNLWRGLVDLADEDFADNALEAEISGLIYINDSWDIGRPYSYDPGTTIFIRQYRSPNTVECVSMEYLFNKYWKNVEKKENSEEVNFQVGELEVFEENKWVDLTRVLRHVSHSDLFSVETDSGNVFIVTEDHPCILEDGTEKTVLNLERGDQIKYLHGELPFGNSSEEDDGCDEKAADIMGRFVAITHQEFPHDFPVWRMSVKKQFMSAVIDEIGDFIEDTGEVTIHRSDNFTFDQQVSELAKLVGMKNVRMGMCEITFTIPSKDKGISETSSNGVYDIERIPYIGNYVYDITTSTGKFYSNGNIVHNCFNYSTLDIALEGIPKLGRLNLHHPKSLNSFLHQTEQFVTTAANMTLGATGLADLLVVASWYVDRILETGKDHKYFVALDNGKVNEEWAWLYVRELITHFIYTVNYEFRGNQSPFTNISLYDHGFRWQLLPAYAIDGVAPKEETLIKLQEVFLDCYREELRRAPITFPVITACLSVKEQDGKRIIKDKEFLHIVSEYNLEFGSVNYYLGETSTLSSCCFSGDTKVVWKSSTKGVQCDTLKNFYELPWDEYKKNLRVFHNGTWVAGKPVKLAKRPMYKVTTANHKTFYMTDNHINVTLKGEKFTSEMDTEDYLAFNTKALQAVPDSDEHLTYEMGYAVGAFLGNGSFGSRKVNGTIFEVNYSQNKGNYRECVEMVDKANRMLGGDNPVYTGEVHNNVYPVRLSSKELVAFIQRWTNWKEGTYSYNKTLNLDCLQQSYDFRKGILRGWYATDGGNSNRCYTSSESLKDGMELLITSLGLNTIIDCSDRTDEDVIIRGEKFNRNYPLWCVRWYEPNNRSFMTGIYKWHNNTQYFKVQSIEPVEQADDFVYCIECKNQEEPYFTLPSGLITHNCRLRSSINDLGYANTFGAGSTKIGSVGVVTLNLPRLAYTAKNDEDFIEKVKSSAVMISYINQSKREFIEDRIRRGSLPLYTKGFMDLKHQYSTCGFTGLYEALEILGKNIREEEGLDFAKKILDSINDVNSQMSEKWGSPHNMEQVPGESSSVKLARKDTILGLNKGEYELYSNQFVPLWAEGVDLFDRLDMQGHLDPACTGGAICHLNVDERITDVSVMETLANYACEKGVVYFAVNYAINRCAEGHMTVGYQAEKCPICGSEITDTFTRVVGFLTNTKHWNRVRREKDWPNRKFM